MCLAQLTSPLNTVLAGASLSRAVLASWLDRPASGFSCIQCCFCSDLSCSICAILIKQEGAEDGGEGEAGGARGRTDGAHVPGHGCAALLPC